MDTSGWLSDVELLFVASLLQILIYVFATLGGTRNARGGLGMALHLEHLSACHTQQTINFIYGTPSAKIILTELYSLCTATHNCNLFATCAGAPCSRHASSCGQGS